MGSAVRALGDGYRADGGRNQAQSGSGVETSRAEDTRRSQSNGMFVD
ncbi:MAG: hypothetical protein NTW28_08495 [Candidatus Solibacter sp.]|nr:hypothetical protein [Candidatus Solibacter sp.]